MFSYIYLFFAAFYGSSISAILPFHPLAPRSSLLPFSLHHTHCSHIYLHEYFSCVLLVLFFIISLSCSALCTVLFCFFFCFRFGLVLLPNTLRKAFHVCCAYEFQIFKNVSIVSLAFVVQVCVSVCSRVCVYGCLCWPEAGRDQGRRSTEMLIVRKSQCALRRPPSFHLGIATQLDRNDF